MEMLDSTTNVQVLYTNSTWRMRGSSPVHDQTRDQRDSNCSSAHTARFDPQTAPQEHSKNETRTAYLKNETSDEDIIFHSEERDDESI